MAASAADIRSALSIPEPSSFSAGPSQTKKPALPNTRKPDGISRELYSLIGPSAPSLAAQLAKPRLKQKPNFGGRGGKTKWSFSLFLTSGASSVDFLIILGSYDLSLMLDDRIISNFGIGRKLH